MALSYVTKDYFGHLRGVHRKRPLQRARWYLLLFCYCFCRYSQALAQISHHMRVLGIGFQTGCVANPIVSTSVMLTVSQSHHWIRQDGICNHLVFVFGLRDNAWKVMPLCKVRFLTVLKKYRSDFYYLIDSQARERRYNATQYLDEALILHGAFSVDNPSVQGLFHFTNITAPKASSIYSVNGCYRDPDWPWYLQSPPPWTLLFLVPLYGIFSALASFQPFFSRELPVMVFVSCCSYAANRVCYLLRFFLMQSTDTCLKGVHILIPSRPDISGAIGAFVIGCVIFVMLDALIANLIAAGMLIVTRNRALGHLYSRIFHGTAFIAMFNGIGFLVPSAIAATGGLAQNYRGKNGSHYTSSLELAMRMITVAIGTTVGLFTSSLVVYSFGRKKRGALWAF